MIRRNEIHNGKLYTFEEIEGLDGVHVSANDQAILTIYIDNHGTIDIPLVHKGFLTVSLTPFGIEAIQDHFDGTRECLDWDDITEIEILGNATEDLCGHCEGCEANDCEDGEEEQR